MKQKQTKETKKFWQTWWFWLIMAFVLIGFFNAVSTSKTTCDCPQTYKTEYNECLDKVNGIQYAWDNYLEALDDYCAIDYTNPLCYVL